MYGDDDLARLQHIAALTFLGLPLQRIKTLLAKSPPDLSATLRMRRRLTRLAEAWLAQKLCARRLILFVAQDTGGVQIV